MSSRATIQYAIKQDSGVDTRTEPSHLERDHSCVVREDRKARNGNTEWTVCLAPAAPCIVVWKTFAPGVFILVKGSTVDQHRCDEIDLASRETLMPGVLAVPAARRYRNANLRGEKFARFGNTLVSESSATPNHEAMVAPYWSSEIDGSHTPRPVTSSGPCNARVGKLP